MSQQTRSAKAVICRDLRLNESHTSMKEVPVSAHQSSDRPEPRKSGIHDADLDGLAISRPAPGGAPSSGGRRWLWLTLAVLLQRDAPGVTAFAGRGPETCFAVVQVPAVLGRLIELPRRGAAALEEPAVRSYVFMEDLIALHVGDLFPGTSIIGCWPFRVTRHCDPNSEACRRDRGDAVRSVRQFVLDRFAAPAAVPDLTQAHRSGATADEARELARPLSPLTPRGAYWALTRLGLKLGGWLSRGIGLGHRTGFDSGATLDYVYRNQAEGVPLIGTAIDRTYLDSIGWKGIFSKSAYMLLVE